MGIVGMLFCSSCGDSLKSTVVENTEYVQVERVIPAIYETYAATWQAIAVILIGSVTYTEHLEGEPEFAFFLYSEEKPPLLFVGCTKNDGSGEYYAYCFSEKRIYQAEQTLKGTLYYNKRTKEFAVKREEQMWDLYRSDSYHLIWLGERNALPNGFEKMKMTSKYCSPPLTEENIKSFWIE